MQPLPQFLSIYILIHAVIGFPACDVCRDAIVKFDKFLSENSTITKGEEIALPICELFHAQSKCEGKWDSWQCEQVCSLAIKTWAPLVDYLAIRYLDPSIICYNIDENIFNCPIPKHPKQTPVPNKIGDNTTHNVEDNDYGYFLQIPDVHWDQQYKENSVANCGEPACCRSYDNDHNYSYPLIYGGKYGISMDSILCDIPYSVIQSMVDYIKNDIINEYNLDFIVFVGDVDGHDVYNQSKAEHLNHMEDFINILKDTLNEFNIAIFFDLGNHEGFPVGNFGGPGIDDWFNNVYAQWLSQWIDTNYSKTFDSQKPSSILSYSGYYSSLIRPGFRLIALNSGYIDSYNYYLKVTQWNDPYLDIGGQLQFLNDTLISAKKLNEIVIIILHHPIDSALTQFQHSYYSLYRQYGDIIMVILAGHTHIDHYHVLGNNNFSSSSNRSNNPFTTWFSAGAVDQYNGRNPSFRVYKYNRNSSKLINFYQYRFDTKQSNIKQAPIWFKAYDALSEYNMKDISAESMTDLAHRLMRNNSLWKRFEYNWYGGVLHSEPLDRNSTVCGLLTATTEQNNDCKNNLYLSSITQEQYEKLYW